MDPKPNESSETLSEKIPQNDNKERDISPNDSNSQTETTKDDTPSLVITNRAEPEDCPMITEIQEGDGGGGVVPTSPKNPSPEQVSKEKKNNHSAGIILPTKEKGSPKGRTKKIARCRGPSSSYSQFSHAVRDSIRKQLEHEEILPTIRNVIQRTTAVWKQLTVDEKEYWELLFRKRREIRSREKEKEGERRKEMNHQKQQQSEGEKGSLTSMMDSSPSNSSPSTSESSGEKGSLRKSKNDLKNFLQSLSEIRYRSVVSELGLKPENMDEEKDLNMADFETNIEQNEEIKHDGPGDKEGTSKTTPDNIVQGHKEWETEKSNTESTNVLSVWKKKTTSSPLGMPLPNQVLRIWNGRTCYRSKNYFDDKIRDHHQNSSSVAEEKAIDGEEENISPKVMLGLLHHQPEVSTILFKHRFGQTAKKKERKARQRKIQKKKEQVVATSMILSAVPILDDNEDDEAVENIPPIKVEGIDCVAPHENMHLSSSPPREIFLDNKEKANNVTGVPASQQTSPIDGLLVPFSHKRSKKRTTQIPAGDALAAYTAEDEQLSAESTKDEGRETKSLLDFTTLTVVFLDDSRSIQKGASKSKRKGLRSKMVPFKVSRTVKWRNSRSTELTNMTKRTLRPRKGKTGGESAESEKETKVVCPSTLKKPPKSAKRKKRDCDSKEVIHNNKKGKKKGTFVTQKRKQQQLMAQFRPVRATEEYFKENREKVRLRHPMLSFNERRKILFSLWNEESKEVKRKFYKIAEKKTKEKAKEWFGTDDVESVEDEDVESVEDEAVESVEDEAVESVEDEHVSGSKSFPSLEAASAALAAKRKKRETASSCQVPPPKEKDNEVSVDNDADDSSQRSNNSERSNNPEKDTEQPLEENPESVIVQEGGKKEESSNDVPAELSSHNGESEGNEGTPMPPTIFASAASNVDGHTPMSLAARLKHLELKSPNSGCFLGTPASEGSAFLKFSLPAHMYNYDPLMGPTDAPSMSHRSDPSLICSPIPINISTFDSSVKTGDNPIGQDIIYAPGNIAYDNGGLGISPMFSPKLNMKCLKAPKVKKSLDHAVEPGCKEANPSQEDESRANDENQQGMALLSAAAAAASTNDSSKALLAGSFQSSNFLSPLISKESAPMEAVGPYVTPEDAAVAGGGAPQGDDDDPTTTYQETPLLELSQDALQSKINRKRESQGLLSPETVNSLSLPPLGNMFSPFTPKKTSNIKDGVDS